MQAAYISTLSGCLHILVDAIFPEGHRTDKALYLF